MWCYKAMIPAGHDQYSETPQMGRQVRFKFSLLATTRTYRQNLQGFLRPTRSGHAGYLGKWMVIVGCFSGPVSWTDLQCSV